MLRRIAASLVALSLLVSWSPEQTEAVTPVPAIEVTPSGAVLPGIRVTFSAKDSKNDGSNVALQYRWNFGEAGANESTPSWTNWSSSPSGAFTYTRAGTKSVRLEIRNDLGQSGQTSMQLTVLEAAKPTVEFAAAPTSGTTRTSFVFTPYISALGYDRDALKIRWDFDADGTWDTDLTDIRSREYSFSREGRYLPRLELRMPDRTGTGSSAGGTGSTIQADGYVLSDSRRSGGRVTVTNAVGSSGGGEGEVGAGVGNRLDTDISFTVSPTEGTQYTNFTFDAGTVTSRSVRYTGSSLDSKVYRWDFDGDGAWDTDWSGEARTTHRYGKVTSDTDYKARLQVRQLGQTLDAVRIVTVERATNPDARFTVTPTKGAATYRTFTFDASSANDPEDGTKLMYRWDFDSDGGWDTDWSESRKQSMTFDTPGEFTATLEVRDTDQFTGQIKVPYEIYRNTGPSPVIWADVLEAAASHEFSFDASRTTDAQSQSSEMSYRWTFDPVTSDESSAISNQAPTADAQETASGGVLMTGDQLPITATSGSTAASTNPAATNSDAGFTRGQTSVRKKFEAVGRHVVRLEVRDPDGLTARVEKEVLVRETLGPTVRISASPSVGLAGTTFTFDAGGTSDVETPAGQLSFSWDFGDAAGSGTFTPGLAQVTHAFQKTGEHRVVVTARDADGKTGSNFAVVRVHWASPAISWAMKNNFTSARDLETFAPDRPVTRAELAKLLVEGRKIPVPAASALGTNPFKDISSGQWWTPYLVTAWRYGLVAGYDDGWVRPERTVTRVEALKMILLGFALNPGTRATTTFPDVDAGSWAAPYASFAHEKGIWRSFSDGTYRPDQEVTRAEAVTMIWGAASVGGSAAASQTNVAAPTSSSSARSSTVGPTETPAF